jgi:hypothetical protein
MKANCWISKNQVRIEDVPEPKILNQRDASMTALCPR